MAKWVDAAVQSTEKEAYPPRKNFRRRVTHPHGDGRDMQGQSDQSPPPGDRDNPKKKRNRIVDAMNTPQEY